jgi:hypothetical protein
MRVTAGKRILRKILETRSMVVGGPTMPETVAEPGGEDAAGVDLLRTSALRFEKHQGPFFPSPLFGQMDREDWLQLQLVHCAHHLSFLLPLRSQ